MQLIDNWKKASKLWSVRFSVMGASIMGAVTAWPDVLLPIWQGMPEEVKGILPDNVVSGVATFLFAMTAVSRVIKQEVNSNADKPAKK